MGTMSSTPLSNWSPGSTARAGRGMILIELVMALGILAFLAMVVFGLLASSRSAYFNVETSIQLRNIFRLAGQKMSWELAHSGHDEAGAAQFTVLAGAGSFGSDIIRFSVPVACDTASSFLTASGSPAHWGAYLTWGCDQASCADADGDCLTVEYKYIQYELNSSGEVVRSVLAPALAVVASQTIARDVTDLRFTASGANSLTFTMSGRLKSSVGRMITTTISQTVRFMN